jgi:hypothetical protein
MPTKRTSRTSAKAVAPSATKLKTLQETLNKNKRLRSAFLADPGSVLRAQGVEIGEAKEKQIASYLTELTVPQRNAFQAEFLRIRIGISVRIRIRINVGITL